MEKEKEQLIKDNDDDFSAKTKMVLTGVPLGYIALVDDTTGTIGTTYRFGNLASATYKILKSESSESSTENTDITRADGAIIRFPKIAPTISGVTGLISSSGTSGSATSKAEMALVVNEAPEECTSWTQWVSIAKSLMGKLCLIVIPTGMTYEERSSIVSAKAVDGWAYMLGRLSADLENQLGSSNTTNTLTFASNMTAKPTEFKADLSAEVFGDITYYLGGGSNDVVLKAPTPSAVQAELVASGDILILPTVA